MHPQRDDHWNISDGNLPLPLGTVLGTDIGAGAGCLTGGIQPCGGCERLS